MLFLEVANKMKIIHVITGMGKAAGTTTFVENVVRELCERGHETAVITNFNGGEGFRADVIHIHGLWSPMLHYAAKWAKRNGIPVVWSTHGMTAPWSMRHKWWKKLLAWSLYQRSDLKRAAAIHCTTELEQKWNQDLGFQNCFVAPLGTNESLSRRPVGSEEVAGQHACLKVLFVGRIYPVKGLVNLIKAASLIKQSYSPNTRTILFRIVGPDQAGHQAELMNLAKRLGVAEMFEWPGPKFEGDLSSEYDRCDILVLPSFTENFGGVVIDALAHGKPVIASKFTPWKILEDNGCGWWVDNDPESLARALQSVTVSDDLCDRGMLGQKLVGERYTWSAVCDKMVEGYESVLV